MPLTCCTHVTWGDCAMLTHQIGSQFKCVNAALPKISSTKHTGIDSKMAQPRLLWRQVNWVDIKLLQAHFVKCSWNDHRLCSENTSVKLEKYYSGACCFVRISDHKFHKLFSEEITIVKHLRCLPYQNYS